MKSAHTQIFYCKFFLISFQHNYLLQSIHYEFASKKKILKKKLQVRKNVVIPKNSICMEQYAYDFVVNRYSQIFMQNF